MEYKVYSAEYKLAMIEEFKSRNITVRAFTQEKNICKSRFERWLQKLRKYNRLFARMPIPIQANARMPIDVTSKAKKIIKVEINQKVYALPLVQKE